MRKRIPIIRNKVYSRIIFELAKQEDYASNLALRLDSKQSVIQRQLIQLKKEGFVKSQKHPEKLKNIIYFSINYEKIILEFISFVEGKSYNSKYKIDNQVQYNPYAALFFKEIFSNYQSIKVFKIIDIYELIRTAILYSIYSGNGESNKEKKEFGHFLDSLSPDLWENQKFREICEDFFYKQFNARA